MTTEKILDKVHATVELVFHNKTFPHRRPDIEKLLVRADNLADFLDKTSKLRKLGQEENVGIRVGLIHILNKEGQYETSFIDVIRVATQKAFVACDNFRSDIICGL